MASARNNEYSGEWVEFEAKEPSGNVGSRPSGRAKRVTLPSKNGKGKGTVISIPRSFIPELKRFVTLGTAFWDAETLDAPAGPGPASQRSLFSLITQGATGTQRIGDAIFIERVIMRFYIFQSVSNPSTVANIAAVLDKEPAAGAPGWLDVFTGTGGGSNALYHVATPEQNNRFRFNYLKRIAVPLSVTTAYYNAAPFFTTKPVVFEMDLKIKRTVEYSPSGGARPYKGCELEMFGWSDISVNTPQCTATAEIFFRDA